MKYVSLIMKHTPNFSKFFRTFHAKFMIEGSAVDRVPPDLCFTVYFGSWLEDSDRLAVDKWEHIYSGPSHLMTFLHPSKHVL